MPRIGTALWVVAAISISIGVNIYRYPAVREMVAATPSLRLPGALSAKPQPSPEPSAAADPSRSAPAGAPRRPEPPTSDADSVPASEAITPAPTHALKPSESPLSGPAGRPCDGPAKEVAEVPPGMTLSGAAADQPEPGQPAGETAGESSLPANCQSILQEAQGETDWQSVPQEAQSATDCQSVPQEACQEDKASPACTAGEPAGAASVAQASSKFAASAEQPTTTDQVRPWRPLAPLASCDDEQVAIPAEAGEARPDAPDASEAGGADTGVRRLPPVDQVWPGKVHGDAPPPAAASIPIYPSTGL
jgi:hypothetical protein